MSISYDFNACEAVRTIMDDCFTKLCTVPFPVEAARAVRVMHYDTPADQPSLVMHCNSYIHLRRINPPSSLRINGVATRKYASVPCDGYSEAEISTVLQAYKDNGYYAYTASVNGATRMYITWDERCLTVQTFSDEEEAQP